MLGVILKVEVVVYIKFELAEEEDVCKYFLVEFLKIFLVMDFIFVISVRGLDMCW